MTPILKTRTTVALLALSSALLLTGCNRFGGKYGPVDKSNNMYIDFKSSDKADLTIGGETHEISYEKSGAKITLHLPKDEGGDIVLTEQSDGTLTSSGLAGFNFKKE